MIGVSELSRRILQHKHNSILTPFKLGWLKFQKSAEDEIDNIKNKNKFNYFIAHN